MSISFELPPTPDTLRILVLHWDELLRRPELLQLDALSEEERRRGQALGHPDSRARFIGLRNLLRILLGRSLGLPPERVPIQVTKAGKPKIGSFGTDTDGSATRRPVGGAHWHFSLAHDRTGAALAFAPRPLGVDREARRQVDCMALASRFFTPGEVRWLAGLAPAELLDGFLSLWTLKESLVKLQGSTLAGTLGRYHFVPARRPLRCYPDGSPEPLPNVVFATWQGEGGEVIGVALERYPEPVAEISMTTLPALLVQDMHGRIQSIHTPPCIGVESGP